MSVVCAPCAFSPRASELSAAEARNSLRENAMMPSRLANQTGKNSTRGSAVKSAERAASLWVPIRNRFGREGRVHDFVASQCAMNAALRGRMYLSALQALQERHQIAFLLGSQVQIEALVVELHGIAQGCRRAVVEVWSACRQPAQDRSFCLSDI